MYLGWWFRICKKGWSNWGELDTRRDKLFLQSYKQRIGDLKLVNTLIFNYPYKNTLFRLVFTILCGTVMLSLQYYEGWFSGSYICDGESLSIVSLLYYYIRRVILFYYECNINASASNIIIFLHQQQYYIYGEEIDYFTITLQLWMAMLLWEYININWK